MLYPWWNLPYPSRGCHLLFQCLFPSLLRVVGLGLGKTQTLPCRVLCAPCTGCQAVSRGSSKSKGAKSLEGINPPLLSLPPPSLGPACDPGSPDASTSVLSGEVELEVTQLGAELSGGLRAAGHQAGSHGVPSLLEDILADFLPGPCCPSTFFLEEEEYLQWFCAGICQVTPVLHLPQDTLVTISQALSVEKRIRQFTSDNM